MNTKATETLAPNTKVAVYRRNGMIEIQFTPELPRQDIAVAIRESIEHNSIVHIRGSEAHVSLLLEECDGDCEDAGMHKFYGEDIDGNEWRVHVRVAS